MRLADATVVIYGLGLMGGSLGLALEGKCARRVGVVRDDDMVATAAGSGAVDEVVDMAVAFPTADIVVLALPVREIVRCVPRVSEHMQAGALLTDLGSTKRAIVAQMDAIGGGVHAVGGHPMCGREVGGLANADGSLYSGARFVLCPSTQSDDASVDLARQLVLAVGAQPVVLDAARHDRAVAMASHVPYAVAQSLVHALAEAEADDSESLVAELAATGFRDTTRVAAGDVTMWLDIMRTNPDAIRLGLEGVDRALTSLRDLLAQGREGEAALEQWLMRGAERRRRLG